LTTIRLFLKERSHNIEKFVNVFQDTSIIISAFTTAYARVYMNQIKLDILAAGASLLRYRLHSNISNIGKIERAYARKSRYRTRPVEILI
jgi:hypothetical protein